jgi:hypothetical protein
MFKKYPLVAIPARNGILGGVLGMVLFIALYFLNRHPFFIPIILDFRIILFSVLIVFTLKEYRNFYQNGMMSFWEGMIMSLVLTVAFSSVAFVVIWAFGEWVPEFVNSYISLKEAQLKLYPADAIERIGRAQYDLFINTLPSTRAIDLALIYFRQGFVLSFFISVIISVILRRQPKTQ